jgi:hypothetical protein
VVIGKNSGWGGVQMNKLQELIGELKLVLFGKGKQFVDSIIPLFVFLIAYSLFGLKYALWGALIVAIGFSIFRLFQKESVVYALGGFVGILLAALLVYINNSAAGFFLPGMISGAITVLLCIVSVLISRPIAAWSSYITRRWPLNWYWHPKVLLAYKEVTIFWAFAFAGRLIAQYWFYQQRDIKALGISEIIFGWPFLIIILIISYLYGIWRLGNLQGPSVQEFNDGTPPPWEGQKRGF